MEYKFILNDFEGPLDVLLYLLKKDNIKIEDIEIEKITEQYVDFINEMKAIDLNIASEYLVMAAELIEMKSYILLPKKEIVNEEIEDPRQELINRLKEYQSYKDITLELKKLEENRKEIYTKEPSFLEDFKSNEKVNEVFDVELLTNAFKEFLKRKELDKPLDTKVTTKEYSVHKRNIEIKNILKNKKRMEFTELFTDISREFIIVTFLSILDLTRKQKIEIVQENNFNKIILIDRDD